MKKTSIGVIFFVLLVGLFCSSSNVFADTSSGVIMDKAYLEGVYTCYTKDHVRTGTGSQSPITLDDFPVFAIGKATSFGGNTSFLIVNDEDGLVLLPTGLTDISDNNLRCNELFIGYSGPGGSFQGLFDKAGITRPNASSSADEKSSFLTSLGYTPKNTGSTSGVCSAINFTLTSTFGSSHTSTLSTTGDVQSHSLCAENLDNGKISNSTTMSQAVNGGQDVLKFSINGKKLTVAYSEFVQQYDTSARQYSEVRKGSSTTFNLSDFSTWDSFMNAVANHFASKKLGSCTSNGGDGGAVTQCKYYTLKLTDTFTSNPTESVFKTFTINDKTKAANSAIKFLSGSDDLKDWNSLAYSDAQKVTLYQKYLEDLFEIQFYDDSCASVTESEGERMVLAGYKKVKWNFDSGAKTCYVKSDKESSVKSVNGINSNNHFGEKIESDDSKTAFQKLLDEIDSITLADGKFAETTENDELTEGEVEQTCVNSGGAVSLGWIVCPILEWLGRAADDTYSNYVEPSLKIEPQLFSDNKDEGTLKAWSTFRDIANLLFVILLLVVIFSQLTGVGIDNYGIKKILPKIIVVAILVNLSYLICLICVDLSNILGNAFKALFDNLSTGTPTLNISDSNLNGSAVVATTLTGVAVLGALVLMVGAVWQNPAILLSLLVSALGVVIAVFFLFILLSARQAAVIVLTVISPLAFICYMLPNTKKLFDRWLKFGEGLLLVYPICGLLVGGGDYVSRLLLSAGFAQGGFISAFTAMIVGVLPIFFIPTVLKGAFAAMGNIGAAITGVGKNLQGRATRGMRNAEGYKTAQKRGLERRTRIKAGYNEKTGELTRGGRIKARFANTRFGRGIGYGKSQAGYIESAKKIAGENESASASLVTALSSADIAKRGGDVKGYYNDMLVKAGNTGNVSNVNAAIAAAVNSGQIKEKDIADMLRNALNDGNIKISNDGTMSNMLREMAAKYGSGFLSTDAELKSFMQKGGVDSGRKLALGGYGDYARAGNMDATDIKKEDVNKLSGDSLSGLIRSGVLDQGMAQQMLAMNPNISNDKRIMLGAAANNLGGGMSVEDFKEAAKSIANNPADAGLISGMTETMAKALTSATPQSVNVVQNFQGGGRQIDSVDVKLR